MRHGEALDFEVAKLEAATGLHQFPGRWLTEGNVFDQSLAGECGAEKGNGVGFAEDLQTTGVILVFMGEKDAVELLDGEADGGEAGANLLGAEASVQQEGGLAGGDDRTISRATAA